MVEAVTDTTVGLQRTVRRDIFLIRKANEMHCFSDLFDKVLYILIIEANEMHNFS